MFANSADNICTSEVSISTVKKTYKIAAEGVEEIVPDANFHPNYPAGTYRVYLSADNSIKIYEEAHEFDLQYETTQCHSSCCYKFGYEDDNGVFHEFANYSIYKDSSLKTPVNLNSLAGLALGGSTWTDGELNWVGSTNKSCTVYISVKDSGYEGVYKGLCYKYNYL